MLLRTQMRVCGQIQPSDAEYIEIRLYLTSKYGSRVLLATYTASLLLYIVKSDHNDMLLSTEATFGFC